MDHTLASGSDFGPVNGRYRIHKTLRVTPVVEAGITSRVWALANLMVP